MKYLETVIFKPNPHTFQFALDRIKTIIDNYCQEELLLIAWLKSDPKTAAEKISQWEHLNQKPLQSVIRFPLDQIANPDYQFSPNPCSFGNGSCLTFNLPQEEIIWVNSNPILSSDCLAFLKEINDYKLWQPEGFAKWEIKKEKTKVIQKFGWLNPQYKKWYEKSLKI